MSPAAIPMGRGTVPARTGAGGVVLDASVALKVVLAEEHSDRAAALVADTVRARQPVYGPPTLHAEALSALYKRTRYRDAAKAISVGDAAQALTTLLALEIDLVAPTMLYVDALAFARAHGLTRTYDVLYVVLAQLLGVELWTDDQHLLNALARTAPWVRWIGTYPLPPGATEATAATDPADQERQKDASG